jgi:hypothetical protein
MRLEKRRFAEKDIDYQVPNYLFNSSQEYEVPFLVDNILPGDIRRTVDFSLDVGGYREPEKLTYVRLSDHEICISYGMINSFYFIVGLEKEITNALVSLNKNADDRFKLYSRAEDTEAISPREFGEAIVEEARIFIDHCIDTAVENDFDTIGYRSRWTSLRESISDFIMLSKLELAKKQSMEF